MVIFFDFFSKFLLTLLQGSWWTWWNLAVAAKVCSNLLHVPHSVPPVQSDLHTISPIKSPTPTHYIFLVKKEYEYCRHNHYLTARTTQGFIATVHVAGGIAAYC